MTMTADRDMLFLLPVFWSDRIAISKVRNASKFSKVIQVGFVFEI